MWTTRAFWAITRSIQVNKSTFTTGGNSIDGSAFSGMNGIATVIQNSGNQVLIQNATVVDVIVR